MLYMIRPGFAEKITAFVENGGTFVTTYSSGLVDENDLCFLGGFPGPLRKLLGVWVEETDALPEGFTRQVEIFRSGKPQTYAARHWFDIIHLEGAECLGEYREDFYTNCPALTRNAYGKGQAYYIASRNESRFQDDFLAHLADKLALQRAWPADLPHGVSASVREKDGKRFVFLLNFINKNAELPIGHQFFTDMETGAPVSPILCLGPYESKILQAS
jgi:beta-galactosidase